ncbi:MAG: beta strand repeat-containing protein [Phycisphaerae bacterium]
MTNGTLEIAAASVFGALYSQTSGTLDVSGPVALNGGLDWRGGVIRGGGSISVSSGAQLSTTGLKQLECDLTLAAAGAWVDSGQFWINQGATLTILPGVIFDIQNASTISFSGGVRGILDNQGTLQKSAGGTSTVQITLLNAGLLDIQSGTVSLGWESVCTGDVQGAGALQYSNSGGTGHSIEASASVSCDNLLVTAGSVVATGSIGSNFQINNGTFAYNGVTTITPAGFTMLGGTFEGTGDVAVNSPIDWRSGTIRGDGDFAANAGGTISTTGLKQLLRNMQNRGAMNWIDTGQLWITNATLSNEVGATFDIQNSSPLSFAALPRGVFDNRGTLRKSVTGQSSFGITLTSSGLIDIADGELSLQYESTISGSVQGAGSLRYANSGGNHHQIDATGTIGCEELIVAAGTCTADGAITCNFVQSGGTFQYDNPAAMQVPSFTQSGGVLTGAGNVIVSGTSDLRGGTLSGTGSFTANGGAQFSTTALKIIERDFSHSGPGSWTDSGQIWIGRGATFTNQPGGTLEYRNDATMSFSQLPRGTFENLGVVRKTVATGTSTILIEFNNSNRVDVQSGTVALSFDGFHVGEFTGTGTLQLSAGVQVLDNSSMTSVSNVVLGGATTTVRGSYDLVGSSTSVTGGNHTFEPVATVLNLGDTLTVSSGTLTLNSGEAHSLADFLQTGGAIDGTDNIQVAGTTDWRGGTIRGSGLFTADGGVSLTTTALKILERNMNASGDSVWSDNGQFWIGLGAAFTNLAGSTFDMQSDAALSFSQAPIGQFHNFGTVLKSSGTGQKNVGVRFNNSGTTSILAGTLSLNSGGTHVGDFDGSATLRFGGGDHVVEQQGSILVTDMILASGTSMIRGLFDLMGSSTTVSGGTHTFEPVALLSHLGDTLLIDGGTIMLNSGEDVSVAAYLQTGGILDGTDAVMVSGLTDWRGGTMRGSGQFTCTGDLALTSNGLKIQERDMVLAGTGNWSDNGQWWIGAGATFTNLPSATFEIQNNAQVSFSIAPRGTFLNQGRLRKTSDQTTALAITFANEGVLEIDAGRFDLNFDFPNFDSGILTGGTYRITGTFEFQNANIQANQATIEMNGPASAIVNQTGNDGIANLGANTALGVLTLNNRDISTPSVFSQQGIMTIRDCTFTAGASFTMYPDNLTTLDNGTIAATSLADLVGGTLRGIGTIDTVLQNLSVVSVGLEPNNPGQINVNGLYRQSHDARIELDVVGSPAQPFDALVATGPLELAGDLVIAVSDPAGPVVNDVYTVLTGSSRTGTFSDVSAPCLTGGNRILVEYHPTDVSLRIVNPLLGDMNCDCALSVSDIGPFVTALTDPGLYQAQFPDCDILLGDINQDTVVSVSDIGGFVALLTGP